MVDFAPLGLIPSPEKNTQVDLSFPTGMEPFRLVVPYPKEESRLLASILPFQPSVSYKVFKQNLLSTHFPFNGGPFTSC